MIGNSYLIYLQRQCIYVLDYNRKTHGAKVFKEVSTVTVFIVSQFMSSATDPGVPAVMN